MSLDTLRGYRKELESEESRVSYWRRLVHARIDQLDETGNPRRRPPEHVGTVLGRERVGAMRNKFLDLHPADGIPPLPDLQEMWNRVLPDGDEGAKTSLLADLRAAEETLSAYRQNLHRRIDSATSELVARYRLQPGLCLSALPSR
jgi:hypothetical protein